MATTNKYNTGTNPLFNTKTTTTMSSRDSYSDYSSFITGANGIWTIIALILAVIGGILVFFLFVQRKKEPKGKFAKWLKNFLAFKIMWIEAIAKIFYYTLTIFVILLSFSFLTQGGSGVLMFLCTIVLGPIVIRIVYESIIMFIMVWRNTKDIAENTKKGK